MADGVVSVIVGDGEQLRGFRSTRWRAKIVTGALPTEARPYEQKRGSR